MTFEPRPYDLISPPKPAGKAGAERSFSLNMVLSATRGWLSSIGEQRRQRRALQDLDDYRLADLGLTREDVSSKTTNWPWQI